MFSLKGKTALVTGSGSGIGAAIAEVFAKAGAHVLVADLDAAGAARTLAIIRGKRLGAVSEAADVKVSEQQLVQVGVGEMCVLIESAANCIEVAASRLNEGRGLPEDPSRRLGWLEIPKVVSTENAIRVVDIAMRLVGGGAFRRGHVLEKLYRDARSGPFHPLTTDQLMQHLGRAELG